MKKTKYPLISVVMLNYNGLKYLKRTIKPILNFDYPNYEFIIVDNGSTDGSIEYIKKFKKIKLIENGTNLGYSKGKNIGVKKAKGMYILLLDEDILIQDKKCLNHLLNENNSLKKCGFISILLSQINCNKTSLYGGYIKLWGFYYNKSIHYSKIKNNSTFKCASPDGGALFFRKNLFEVLGGYDLSQPYYIDVGDLGIRAVLKGFNNYVYNQSSFIHLGIERKTSLESWCWKYKYNFSGIMRVIIKNLKFKNLFSFLLINYVFFMLKTLKNALSKISFKVLTSFLLSHLIFFKNLPDTLKQRKIIQSKRVIKDDIFLKIKPPKF